MPLHEESEGVALVMYVVSLLLRKRMGACRSECGVIHYARGCLGFKYRFGVKIAKNEKVGRFSVPNLKFGKRKPKIEQFSSLSVCFWPFFD
jgi:hypothetical protein